MMRTLRALEGQGIIYRIRGRSDEAHGFALTRAGSRRFGFKPPLSRLYYQTREHDLVVNDVRFVLESLGLGNGFVSNRDLNTESDDPLLEKFGNISECDGVFFIPSEEKLMTAVLELDLNFRKPYEYKRQLTTYSKNSKIDLILYLSPHWEWNNPILKVWRDLAEYGSPKLYSGNWREFFKTQGETELWTIKGKIKFHEAFNLRNWTQKVNSLRVGQEGEKVPSWRPFWERY
jgi:hypothetical protein